MGRLVILLAVVCLVAVGYALMPAEYVPSPETPNRATQETARPMPTTPAAMEPVKAKPRREAKTRVPKRVATPARKALDVAPDEEALTAEEEAIFKPLPSTPPPPPPMAPQPPPRPQWTKRYGRDPATEMPVLTVGPIKNAVRAFYGNLPKGGRMPRRIEIQEVLPLSVIAALNVPPESQLTMLGPYETNVTTGLQELLKLPDTGEGIFGVSVVTPNGEKHRDYIKTKP
jgi:hypothetical protein